MAVPTNRSYHTRPGRPEDLTNAVGQISGSGRTSDVDKFFSHHGVKGMHWGVRKTSANVPSSEDATRAAHLHSQVKASGTKTLSNQELQALITRMNLESQYKNLSDKNKTEGQKFIDSFISEAKKSGEQEVKQYVKNQTPKIAAVVSVAVAKHVVGSGKHKK